MSQISGLAAFLFYMIVKLKKSSLKTFSSEIIMGPFKYFLAYESIG